jgi:hypothetical protein
MTPVATVSTRQELRTRASVLVDFELGQLVSEVDDVDEVLDFIDDDCDLIRTVAGHDRWSIKEARRTQTLTGTPLDRLREIRSRLETETTPLQRTLDRSLDTGWTPSQVEQLPVAEARLLSVVATWWAGTRPQIPSGEEMRRLVDRLSLFADVRAMAKDHFIGRHALLADLAEHFRRPGTDPFAIHGLGGIGKSAVMARHVVWAIDEAQAKVALLDFDDASLNPHFPADLVSRIVERVGRQLEYDVAFGRIVKSSHDIAENASYGAEGHYRDSAVDTYGWHDPIKSMAGATPDPILVVFDTVEQVQRRGPAAVASLISLVNTLVQEGIRVVLCGRTELPLPARSAQLTGLERDEAARLLTDMTTMSIPVSTAAAVVDQIGTSPLTVRLAARLLAANDGEPSELFAIDVMAEQINAELYRRVLDHIEDAQVRQLAHPGLILRRITPEIILKVLAKPCGVPVVNLTQARDLFDRFANEAMLVDRSPDSKTLLHRSDLRAIMLPQLTRDRPDDARRIQRAAVKYYAARDDHVSTVEELYHRLMLEQAASTLEKHWDSLAAEELSTAMDELPRTSRVFLSAHLPKAYLREEDRRLLSDATWIAKIEPQVLRLIFAHDADAALGLLRERRTPHGGSLLPALEIEVLESLGRFDEAIDIAREQRRSAAKHRDLAGVVTFSLHLCRLLERTGRAQESGVVLTEAIASIKDPTIDRLRLLVAWLGHHRRLGQADTDTHRDRQRETIALHKRLGPDVVQKVPGLLRDLAAEVGTESPDILNSALKAVGLDARAVGSVPAALRELDHVTAQEKGTTPGMVADIARLERKPDSDDAADWDEIANLDRGETGYALSEVMTTFPDSSDSLKHAVAVDYQHEADGNYLGTDFESA